MTPQSNPGQLLLYAFVGVFAFAILLAIYRRREAVGLYIRWAAITLGVFVLTVYIVKQFTSDPGRIILAALLAEMFVGMRMKPCRSRYISRIERRKAIARYEQGGRRYDPKRHHIDHVIPYARGGSSKADNLRVREKEENLAKSDRSPWWDVFSR